MPTLPKRAARRVRAAAEQLSSRSLLLPMMVSFVCFIGCVLLILSIWFTRNVAATLEDVLYENVGQSAGQTVSQMTDALRGVANIAAHLSYANELSPRPSAPAPTTRIRRSRRTTRPSISRSWRSSTLTTRSR